MHFEFYVFFGVNDVVFARQHRPKIVVHIAIDHHSSLNIHLNIFTMLDAHSWNFQYLTELRMQFGQRPYLPLAMVNNRNVAAPLPWIHK